MKYVKMMNKIIKQPIKDIKNNDIIVICGDKKFFVTGIEYESGKLIGLKAVEIGCKTCKNNPKYHDGEYPPHTCDMCDSLDAEPYCMWGTYMHPSKEQIAKRDDWLNDTEGFIRQQNEDGSFSVDIPELEIE